MEPEGSLPHSQEPATYSYSHPDISIHAPYPTFPRSVLILSSHLSLVLPCSLHHSGFPTNFMYALLLSPILATCPAHLNLLDLITRMIFVRNTENTALCYVVFSTPLLPHPSWAISVQLGKLLRDRRLSQRPNWILPYSGLFLFRVLSPLVYSEGRQGYCCFIESSVLTPFGSGYMDILTAFFVRKYDFLMEKYHLGSFCIDRKIMHRWQTVYSLDGSS
jgi:hypothetical protein